MDYVFLFHQPNRSKFCGAVFTDRNLAEDWIKKHVLTGVLTKYPINIGVYDWAIENNLFKHKKEEHYQPDFIGGFSSAAQEHYHYEDGVCVS